MITDDNSDEESLRAAFHSAQGYFQLGMLPESREALAELSREQRLKPDVLELEILLLVEEQRWPEVVELATVALRLYPTLAYGYVHLAYGLHELKKTQEALLALENAPESVFSCVEACYNRACYLACMQRQEEAKSWLNRAVSLNPQARDWACKDPDLSPLRERLPDKRPAPRAAPLC